MAGISYLRVKKATFLATKTSTKLNIFLWKVYMDSQTCSWQISYKKYNRICSFLLCLLRFLHAGMPASPWDILILQFFTSRWKHNDYISIIITWSFPPWCTSLPEMKSLNVVLHQITVDYLVFNSRSLYYLWQKCPKRGLFLCFSLKTLLTAKC